MIEIINIASKSELGLSMTRLPPLDCGDMRRFTSLRRSLVSFWISTKSGIDNASAHAIAAVLSGSQGEDAQVVKNEELNAEKTVVEHASNEHPGARRNTRVR